MYMRTLILLNEGENKVMFIETSALDSTNVSECFNNLVQGTA